jgi:hypothetical protein
MMRKKVFRVGAMLVLCLIMVLGTATSAFAYYNEDEANEGSTVVVEEPAEETTTETEAPSETETPADEPQGQITPDGNLTLVDDLDYSSRAGLQFMTVTSKDGHVFYIVIDRTANSENVYFLNQVDAADLMALMNDEQKEEYLKEQEAKQQEQQQTTVTPAQQETQAPSETEQPAQTEAEKQPLNNSMVMIAVFGVIGIGVIAAYYFLKIKPKKNGSSIDEDREFYDDEEYENEDQEPAFAEDDEE